MNRHLLSFLFSLVILFLFPSRIFGQVLINEFFPKSPEWVEFYNISSGDINLGDYFFDDDTDFSSDSGTSAKFKLQGILSTSSTCFWEMTTFLNDGGDNPTLFGSNGDVVDTYSYASSSATTSYSRVPDGGNWQLTNQITKSQTSCLSLPTPTPSPTPGLMSSASPTQTPAPTSTPTKSPTPVPTKVLTAAPTKTPQLILGERTSSVSSDVAGLRNELATPKPASSGGEKSGFPLFAIGLVAIGVAFIGTAGFLAFKKSKMDLPPTE